MAEWVPQMTRCVDTFQVVQWVTNLLDKEGKQARGGEANARAEESTRKDGRPREGAEKPAAKAVRDLRYPPPEIPEDLKARQAADLEMDATSNPRPCRAYLPEEGLRLALKALADEIREAFETWKGRAWRSRIPEFAELRRNARRHMSAIVATATFGAANAQVETVNNKIRLIVKMAHVFQKLRHSVLNGDAQALRPTRGASREGNPRTHTSCRRLEIICVKYLCWI